MKKLFEKIKTSKRLQRILGGILAVLIIGGIFFFLKTTNRVSIENSLLTAPVVSITPSTPGVLTQMYVTEGQTVSKGDALAVVGSETLRAYSDGIIISTNRQIGGTISQQTPIIKMINPAELRVDGTLDENKGLKDIHVGQVVGFTVDALPGQTFWGYVDEISPTAKQTQAAFSISSERPTQQFEIFARFDTASHPEIKNGMSAKMIVYTK